MENTDYKNIKGWGVDANPENEPTYPMRTRSEDDPRGYTWNRPTQQHTNVEILHSNERPSVSSVFGTSTPPKGLSGMIRRWAFKYSEGSYGHWLPLILADRINVYEGICSDLRRGYIPNILAERGWKAEWKYNRKQVVRNMVSGFLLTTLLIGIIVLKKSESERD